MNTRWLPYAAAGLCALVVLPGLGGPGFWDPQELAAVDAIRQAAADGITTGPTDWVSARTMAWLGAGELPARLGPALLGVLAALLVYATGNRLAGPRAAAISVAVLVSCPMFILHARLAKSSMAAMVGVGAIGLGVAGLRRLGRRSVIDAVFVIGGAAVCAWSIASWKIEWGDARAGFAWASRIEGVVYGAFPAVVLLLLSPSARRCRAASWLCAAAAATCIACTVVAAASAVFVIPLLALTVGLILDRPRMRARATGVCALAIALVLGRDLMRFPGKLAALSLGTEPKLAVTGLASWLPMAAGVALGGAALWCALDPRRTRPMIAAVIGLGLGLGHVWLPAVSDSHSQKHLFAVWRDLRGDDDRPIGLWRVSPRAAREYAPDQHRVLGRPAELSRELSGDAPAFAIAPGSELCSLRSANVAADAKLFVVAGRPESFVLLSNRLPPAMRDRSPLRGVLVRGPPPGKPGATPVIGGGDPRTPRGGAARRSRQAIARFGEELELVDVELPAAVRRGSRFEVVMRYRVLSRPSRAWKVFAHFDGPGIRFQGDHEPLGKTCSPRLWLPGDIVVDRFTVKAGNLSHPRGRYLVWVGFFVGSHGNWTNLEVVSGERDENDRLHVGSIEIR